MSDDDFDVQGDSHSGWQWVYQTPGGSWYQSAKRYKTRKAALDAAHSWRAEWEEPQ